MTRAEITRVQQRLKELVIYHGRIDGVLGPMTLASIRGFQRISGLKQDGVVGPKTAAELWPAPIPGRDAIEVEAPAVNPVWPRQKDVPSFFGEVGKNQTQIELPYPMWLAWDLRKSIHRMTLHEKVAPSAQRAFTRILGHYGKARVEELDLDVFGGSLAVRKMRGGSSWSMHSWGIAIDFDPVRNQLKWGRERAALDNPEYAAFWGFWEQEGWVSLGRAKNFDWMHVQAARL
jgi:hypothetical protein